MQKELSLGMLSTALTVLLVLAIFTAIAPSTTADVSPQAAFGLTKKTLPNDNETYRVGDTIDYSIRAGSVTSTYNATVDIWDVLPNGEIKYLENDSFFLAGEIKWFNFSDTVDADWVDPDDRIRNRVYAYGFDENPSAPDEINVTITKTSVILPEQPPKLNFTFVGIGCRDVEFNGSASVDPDGTIANHTWYYGDGATSGVIAGPPDIVSHTYATCGSKTVKLAGYDDRGNYAETEESIYVDCGPTAIARADPGCFVEEGSMVSFIGTQSHADLNNHVYPQTIVNWSWSFSDGVNGSSDWSPTTSRLVNDTVIATLTVRDSLGCEDSTSVSVDPCSEVPLVNPLGLIALLGALSAVLLLGIRRKVR